MSTSEAPEDVPVPTPPVRSNTAKSQVSISRPGNLIRKASETFSQSRPPVGMFHAFGSVGSNIPTLNDIQTGKFSQEGWSGPGQRRNSLAHRETDVEVLEVRRQRTMSIAQSPKVPIISEKKEPGSTIDVASTQVEVSSVVAPHDPSVPYANGYQFPPKHTKKQAFKIAMKGSWNFVTTPFGFLLTIYALNIVAWGGMLFLILIHATPAMAHPSYNDDYSGAKIWLEITAQILNALFCVTGLGLIPWRFRDLYYLLVWRLQKKEEGLRRLAGIHRNWFRLKGSQEIDIHFDPSASPIVLPEGVNESALALPISLTPDAPLTGERASASKYWMMDFVVWMFVWNTFLQIILCGFMWGYNRFKRPGAAVGALISLACIVASAAGYLIFREGKRVKKVEGVPVSEDDMEILREMRGKEGNAA